MAGGAGTELVATGSDDGTVKIWEGGEEGGKQAVATFDIGCPVTSVCWGADGANVYIGALDNEIHVSAFPPLASPFVANSDDRYTILEKASKCTHLRGILTRQRPWRSLRMEVTFSLPPSRRTPSSMIFDPSLPLRRGYIASCRVHRLDSRTLFYGVRGAKTMEAGEWQLVVQTERCAYGTSIVARYCTK